MESTSERLLMSFYGDDFTGSTDSMEALAFNGMKTVLFLEPPTNELIASRFPDIRAFGIAGVSRTMGIAQMERELKPILQQLKRIPTPIVHYKVCSTFDSSPTVGSIGHVMNMASGVFPDQAYIPLLVGAPVLKRYTLFGQHFATVGQETHRLDRHPTMSRHPVTPMDEADLRLHLSRQTNKKVALMDILDLDGDYDQVQSRLAARLSDNPDVLLFDVLDEERLRKAGRLIWEEANGRKKNRFVVGSSGVEYALAAHFHESGLADLDFSLTVPRGSVDRIFVVSGSCSPVTESQISYALSRGFVGIRIEADRLIDRAQSEQVRSELLRQASDILAQGKSPLLFTASGPDDPTIEALQRKLKASGLSASDSGQLIGEQLGLLTREVVERNNLQRFVVAGGDTSGFVTRELSIYALESIMPLAPGGPLCKGYSENPRFEGIEMVLKGGQVGKEDYFVRALEG